MATTSTASQPGSTTEATSDLQVMIADIPIAQDGDMITADYPNALRQALVAVADRLGVGPLEEDITITNAPRLNPFFGMTEWDHDVGLVRRPATFTTGVRGWMAVDLPHGSRIKRMVIFATNGNGPMKVRLKRQKINDPVVTVDLIVIDVPNNADITKGIEGDVTASGFSTSSVPIEESRLVNNREQKYIVAVEQDGATADKPGQLAAVQIVCGG
jgi:hypothetical protein